MSVSYQCVLDRYTKLTQLIDDLNEILAINLQENEYKDAFLSLLNIEGFHYQFYVTCQDYLENDRDLDFENYDFILGVTLLDKYNFERQHILIRDFFIAVLEQLAQKDENLTHAMIVYDVQAVLLRWFK